jgi:hypothetical protein
MINNPIVPEVTFVQKASTTLLPDEQLAACSLLQECMQQVDEIMPLDLAIRVEMFLKQTGMFMSLMDFPIQ